MNRLNKTAIAAALLASVALPASAQAATLVINLTGIQTFDAFQDTSNIVQLYNIGAGAHITGSAYNVTIQTIGDSFLSEASIYYTDSGVTTGVVTRPGVTMANSGTGTFTGNADLVALGIDFFVGADGILRLEYAESFDDNPNLADATFTAGTFTITYDLPGATAVPEPATWAMMIGGFGMVGGAMRRRAKVKTTVAYA